MTETVLTRRLAVGVELAGPLDGPVAVLLHGFPYDVHAFDEVTPILVAAGCRVLVPYLRGYGPTRFRDPETPRAGQQAALGQDVLELLDALGIERAVLAGYDWGGRAACVVAARWPARVAGLVTVGGYAIQDIGASAAPASPAQEHRFWYQYYFHTPRGAAGLAAHRAELCELLWRLWSPTWAFTPETYARTAPAFDNPDFVDVVVHSYRHRFGYAAGDPAYEPLEQALAARPPIAVPTIACYGEADGVTPYHGPLAPSRSFTGPCEIRTLPDTGHNVPQEAPAAFAQAVLDLIPPARGR
jgi:pimeloyl-ACP methyl ester carboxylesterase